MKAILNILSLVFNSVSKGAEHLELLVTVNCEHEQIRLLEQKAKDMAYVKEHPELKMDWRKSIFEDA